MPDSRKRLADGAFLIALMLYILGGVALAPAHGDEFMQMSMARDYFYMVRGEWARLAYAPPVEPDTEQHLRLINGSVNKLLIGLVWHISGRDPASLPGIYAWAMPLAWNQAQGNVPPDDALHLARLPSAILTALGVLPIFMLGWHLRLRSLAYPAALLYALHPAILLNGRRAMMEGGLMLFSLLSLYWLVAMIVAEHSAAARGLVRRLPILARYAILGVLIGLAVAAKHTGIVVAGSGLLAALLAGLMRDRSWRTAARVAFAGVIGLAVWFALNPAYWADPVGALRATLEARVALLDAQSAGAALAHDSLLDRAGALIVQPFLTPTQYYEAPTWADAITGQIAAYERSVVNGWHWGGVFGGLFTLLAGIGLAALIYDARRRDLIAWAILIWTGATALASLAIPLNWQRYYLPLELTAIILAAAGLGRLLVQRTAVEAESGRGTLERQGVDRR